jgi:hypothetical protein
MSDDFEGRLTAVLHHHADRPVDADALLAAARDAGRARRRRRNALAGTGVAGVTAAALVAVPVGLGTLGGSGDGVNGVAGGQLEGPVPAPPTAPGAAALADRPDLVGTNARVVRYVVGWAPLPVDQLEWGVHPGVENVRLALTAGAQRSVDVGIVARTDPNPDQLDVPPVAGVVTREVEVAGRPGVLMTSPDRLLTHRWLFWSPVDGVDMRVTVTVPDEDRAAVDDADVVRLASSIRLDRTARCAAPMQLTHRPTAAPLTSCENAMEVGSDPRAVASGSASFGEFDDGLFVSYVAPAIPAEVVPTDIPWLSADPSPGSAPVFAPTTGQVTRIVGEFQTYVSTTGGYTEADARAVADGLQPGGRADELASWTPIP